MSNIFKSTDFGSQLEELQTLTWQRSENRGEPVIEQTTRNNIRRELLAGLMKTLEKVVQREDGSWIANLYMVKEGIAVEVESDCANETVPDGNGTICFLLKPEFKNLHFDAFQDSEDYNAELEAAKAKAAKRATKSNS